MVPSAKICREPDHLSSGWCLSIGDYIIAPSDKRHALLSLLPEQKLLYIRQEIVRDFDHAALLTLL